MKIYLGVLVVALAVLPACSNDSLVGVCLKAPQIQLYVEVHDSLTNAKLTANNLSGHIYEASTSFTGMLNPFNANGALEYLGADRPGTYDVVVDATGYKTWTQKGVAFILGTDNCGVTPVELTAKLQKAT
jgi:hypothetical protein